ncbi:PqqD family protein [Prochlorococcus marinus XMU1412]|uniref:PqqD family protein n=1 Tax=Prochlorococcus marinus TaxID=1219 RepID=UPI001ADAB065|nr:PqqD family protein [Prochlorococcus marinus]MBO8240569.1 PqqD family protein [Prochlorococcus marinus XMU1412]MBW3071803.1 hypothetical protein [Prochlorococcus marinus str. MU1412]
MKLKKNPKLVSEVLDEEICLFNPKNAKYINLNSTGSIIWGLLDTSKEVDEIIKIMKKGYKDKNTNIENEIMLFINDGIANDIFYYEK